MADDTPRDVRKRILFISGLLVFMVVIAGLVVFKAAQSERYTLLATVLPLFITAFPLTRSLLQLRADARVAGDPASRA